MRPLRLARPRVPLPVPGPALEQQAKPLALPQDALPGAPLPLEVPPKAQMLRCQGAEFGPRCAGAGGFGPLAPALKRGLDVPGEDLRQVVVAVELVDVVDAGEGHGAVRRRRLGHFRHCPKPTLPRPSTG